MYTYVMCLLHIAGNRTTGRVKGKIRSVQKIVSGAIRKVTRTIGSHNKEDYQESEHTESSISGA